MNQPEPAPDRDERPRAAAESEAAKGHGAYVPKPDLESRGVRTSRWMTAGLLALLLAAGAGGLRQFSHAPAAGPTRPPPTTALGAADVRQEKVFLFSSKELDAARTQKAREMLKAGQVPPELQQAPQAVREAVRDGGMSLFTMHVIDFADEDGDAVGLSVDGLPIGVVDLSHRGADLTIPLKPNTEQRLTVTAVRDGGGGVTFGANTSTGHMLTRVMDVGQSETWTITFKR